MLREADTASTDTPPADIPDQLPSADLETIPVGRCIKNLIVRGHRADPIRYPSRSEALWRVLQALVRAGLDDGSIAGIVLDDRHAIGEKPRQGGRRWVAHKLSRARAKCRMVMV
jgi:hypothetical protein